jgi:hypothetical protein
MLVRLHRRLHRGEEGYALVTSILLLAIMSLLMMASLAAGDSVNNLTGRGARWTALLGVTESGVNDAVTRLSANRNAVATSTGCKYDGTSTAGCAGPGGEYQVTWQKLSRGKILITSYGFYPSVSNYLSGAANSLAREVQVTMGPEKSFKYALFSETTLDIKNNTTVIGDIFSNAKLLIENNAIVCGNVDNASLGVELGDNAMVVKGISGSSCESDANVTSGGSISMDNNGATIEGDATASGPTQQDCPPTPDTNYSITGGQVLGTATACGVITSTAPNSHPGTKTSPPVTQALPSFTFDPANYTDLTCFPSSGTCGPSNTTPTAVTSFNALSKTNMTGTYAVWQTQPTSSTRIDLEGMSLGGDLTVVTNAPIDFGNTSDITGTSGSNLVLVSLYVPPTGTTCSESGGDCSIYGKNAVIVDAGDPNDPDDGIAMLLYTPGKMAFKNQANAADGALYAGSMDIKNGFSITYNERVDSISGFGAALKQKLWVELKA